jgi:hypothetical protein
LAVKTCSGSFFRFVPVRFFEQNVKPFISGNLAGQHFSAFAVIFRFVFHLLRYGLLILNNFSGSFLQKKVIFYFARTGSGFLLSRE